MTTLGPGIEKIPCAVAVRGGCVQQALLLLQKLHLATRKKSALVARCRLSPDNENVYSFNVRCSTLLGATTGTARAATLASSPLAGSRTKTLASAPLSGSRTKTRSLAPCST